LVEQSNLFRRRLQDSEGWDAGYCTFSQPDLIIAATALQHGLTIVSRDIRDYQKAGAAVRNPWHD
jgi:predicted nucleic acid-binding protein